MRLQVFDRDKWQCQECYAGDQQGVTLNAHHHYYVKDKERLKENAVFLLARPPADVLHVQRTTNLRRAAFAAGYWHGIWPGRTVSNSDRHVTGRYCWHA